ncbi:hypothetical protein AB0M45_08555 [Nocardia sp. NPDC051787]|uniref:hypothetical protein n=1 Tax=Nocardia sp. NPDC051787 TaxID=3155415 RepID=UPI0034489D63
MTVPCGVPADFDAPMPEAVSTVTIVGSARLGDRGDARTGMWRLAAAGSASSTAPTTFSTFGYERIRLVADVIDVAVGSAVTRRSWT